ncbi:hypothetical protein [Nocardioides endophyticus]|uniref:hypothetical protein n=1 Tax=Nocardioides endophyticus TaxID=1353775 RepID=UPI0031E7176E
MTRRHRLLLPVVMALVVSTLVALGTITLGTTAPAIAGPPARRSTRHSRGTCR